MVNTENMDCIEKPTKGEKKTLPATLIQKVRISCLVIWPSHIFQAKFLPMHSILYTF